MSSFGAQDMVSPLRRVLMKRPGQAMSKADPKLWHYDGNLDLDRLQADHDALVKQIHDAGAEVLFLEEDDQSPRAASPLADLAFTHDPSLVTAEGAILLRMGKRLRRGEEQFHKQFYERNQIPICATIEDPGTVEAGDCLWLDTETLIVGISFRTNQAGADQLERILSDQGVTVHAFDLPTHQGVDVCLHLTSLISMLDHDLALVHEPLLPVRLRQLLQQLAIKCLVAPADEFTASNTLSVNVLALAPRHCIMVEGYPKTLQLLQDAGCQTTTFCGNELCGKAEGGPTCLTRPLLRNGLET
ncbi:MAG: arginine deiminase family protein [Planctomycetales bacterium]